MAKVKSVLSKLNSKIESLEKEKNLILEKKIKELYKTDSELIEIVKQLDVYTKFKQKKEEQIVREQKLNEEIEMFLNDSTEVKANKVFEEEPTVASTDDMLIY